MRVTLILPRQRSRYSVLYDVYNDLCLGLSRIGAQPEVLQLDDREGEDFPYFPVRRVGVREALDMMRSPDAPLVTVDDHPLMGYLYRARMAGPITVWAQYFYGHNFFLARYRDLWRRNFGAPLRFRASSHVPQSLWSRIAKFYWEPLRRSRVLAQSLWTALLLGRVYDVPVLGVLHPPIEPSYYPLGRGERRGALVFLGGEEDTDLFALSRAMRALRSVDPGIEFDYFGDEGVGEEFNRRFGEDMRYLGRLERADLGREYSKHAVTIAPVYNGNFEMVPVQSLLAGAPVITYMQPFMEVVGRTPLVANVEDAGAVEMAARRWLSGDPAMEREVEAVRGRILGEMDPAVVASRLLEFLPGEDRAPPAGSG
ncbi:MAG: glycosyltransferase [Nitrososphaeria archaeon]